MEFGILLRLVGLMNLTLILSHPFILQREPVFCDYVKKKKTKTAKHETTFNVGLCSDIYVTISVKFGMMIETTGLTYLVSVWISWSSFKVTVVSDTKNPCVHFLGNFTINWAMLCMLTFRLSYVCLDFAVYAWAFRLCYVFVNFQTVLCMPGVLNYAMYA